MPPSTPPPPTVSNPLRILVLTTSPSTPLPPLLQGTYHHIPSISTPASQQSPSKSLTQQKLTHRIRSPHTNPLLHRHHPNMARHHFLARRMVRGVVSPRSRGSDPKHRRMDRRCQKAFFGGQSRGSWRRTRTREQRGKSLYNLLII